MKQVKTLKTKKDVGAPHVQDDSAVNNPIYVNMTATYRLDAAKLAESLSMQENVPQFYEFWFAFFDRCHNEYLEFFAQRIANQYWANSYKKTEDLTKNFEKLAQLIKYYSMKNKIESAANAKVGQ